LTRYALPVGESGSLEAQGLLVDALQVSFAELAAVAQEVTKEGQLLLGVGARFASPSSAMGPYIRQASCLIEEYYADDYVDHNPQVPPGRRRPARACRGAVTPVGAGGGVLRILASLRPAVTVEHLTVILSNPDWRNRVRRAKAAKGSERIIAPKPALTQRSAEPCACGCGETVNFGRRFINQHHQSEWMRSGGASALISKRWRS
jgi:hypothetical protein